MSDLATNIADIIMRGSQLVQEAETAHRLKTLAANLAQAAMLCRAFRLGTDYGYMSCFCGDAVTDDDRRELDANHWTPGCGRSAT